MYFLFSLPLFKLLGFVVSGLHFGHYHSWVPFCLDVLHLLFIYICIFDSRRISFFPLPPFKLLGFVFAAFILGGEGGELLECHFFSDFLYFVRKWHFFSPYFWGYLASPSVLYACFETALLRIPFFVSPPVSDFSSGCLCLASILSSSFHKLSIAGD